MALASAPDLLYVFSGLVLRSTGNAGPGPLSESAGGAVHPERLDDGVGWGAQILEVSVVAELVEIDQGNRAAFPKSIRRINAEPINPAPPDTSSLVARPQTETGDSILIQDFRFRLPATSDYSPHRRNWTGLSHWVHPKR